MLGWLLPAGAAALAAEMDEQYVQELLRSRAPVVADVVPDEVPQFEPQWRPNPRLSRKQSLKRAGGLRCRCRLDARAWMSRIWTAHST
jgi:hypothetical protein